MPDQEEKVILVPIVPQSYKRLDKHVPDILKAAEGTGALIAVTASPGDIPEADGHPQYRPISRMTAEELTAWWGRATAIFFPPTLESFGYALAEARCGGRPVIAPDTRQNREITGPALCSYNTVEQLSDAVRAALGTSLRPDPVPFDPVTYFDTLLD